MYHIIARHCDEKALPPIWRGRYGKAAYRTAAVDACCMRGTMWLATDGQLWKHKKIMQQYEERRKKAGKEKRSRKIAWSQKRKTMTKKDGVRWVSILPWLTLRRFFALACPPETLSGLEVGKVRESFFAGFVSDGFDFIFPDVPLLIRLAWGAPGCCCVAVFSVMGCWNLKPGYPHAASSCCCAKEGHHF